MVSHFQVEYNSMEDNFTIDALREIEELDKELRDTYEMPPLDLIG